VYYKDRQLKERSAVAGASAIANLKFLLVNGDDDGFNTAIKAYIDEAVRSAFGALVDNLDKGTAISRVLATDANHDLGSITPANLASVLGGWFMKENGRKDNVAISTFGEGAFVTGYIQNASDAPSGISGSAIIIRNRYDAVNFSTLLISTNTASGATHYIYSKRIDSDAWNKII